jgi:hypothetical protein
MNYCIHCIPNAGGHLKRTLVIQFLDTKWNIWRDIKARQVLRIGIMIFMVLGQAFRSSRRRRVLLVSWSERSSSGLLDYFETGMSSIHVL